MDVVVTIGPETADDSVTVTISDDQGWSPDLLEMAASRATTHALWLYRELHPTPQPPTLDGVLLTDADQAEVRDAIQRRLNG